jgi:hypothetical protein
MKIPDARKPPIPHSVSFFLCCGMVVMDVIAAGTTGESFFLSCAALFVMGAFCFWILDAAGVDKGNKK